MPYSQFSLCERPDRPGSADSATPGFNVDYSSNGESAGESSQQASAAGTSSEQATGRRQREIRMTDENGRPASGERYRITRAGQSPIEGRLDENGRGFVDLDDLEGSDISFFDLDQSRWRPIR